MFAILYRERSEARQAQRRADDSVHLGQEEREVVVAFVNGLRKPVGKGLVAKGLRGSHAKPVKRAKLMDNPLFGALKGLPERAVIRTVEELLADEQCWRERAESTLRCGFQRSGCARSEPPLESRRRCPPR